MEKCLQNLPFSITYERSHWQMDLMGREIIEEANDMHLYIMNFISFSVDEFKQQM